MANPPTQRAEPRVTVSFSDTINLIRKQVEWSPKGVSLLTKWPFAVGAEIEFAFDHESERHCCSGVVVGCRPLRRPAHHFETVIYFVETPCHELRKAACDCQLAHRRHYPEASAGEGAVATGRPSSAV